MAKSAVETPQAGFLKPVEVGGAGGRAVAPVEATDRGLAGEGNVQRERQNYAGADCNRANDQPVDSRPDLAVRHGVTVLGRRWRTW